MRLTEIPYRIVPDSFDGQEHLSRINQVTNSEKLEKVHVSVIGAGGLGSAVVGGTAGTGIVNYIIVDMDTLGVSNTTRHLGGIQDVGKQKTQIFKEYIQSHQPLARVQTVNEDLVKNTDLLKRIIEWSDIVISASGNPELHYTVNSICVDLGKPSVYGGVFEKAKESYVFYYSGKKDDRCCWECIMDVTASEIDQSVLNRRYGLENGELHAEQGLNCDIAVPGLLMAKIAISHLLGENAKFNLVRYYNMPKIILKDVMKKPSCAVCDYDNWLEQEREKLCEKGSVKKTLAKIKDKISPGVEKKKTKSKQESATLKKISKLKNRITKNRKSEKK